jgi:hypothetical protein
MGLDQYLYRKSYLLSGDWVKPECREEVLVTKGGQDHGKIKNDRIRYVVEEVGYWRKSNQIHKWFVDNVQNGKDDCGEYKVTRLHLEKLLKACEEVMQDYEETGGTKAHEILPTTDGCFFGNQEYDSWYFKDIEYTIEIVKELLSNREDIEEYYYVSSW